ncbi:MAG: glycosyltransferase [Chloroflexi bacterium]|nr:glycosyltransferase [Chloroflexota bacterium]
MNNNENPNLKLLILGEPLSIHTIRWVKQLLDTGWDIRLFCPLPPKWSVWADGRWEKVLHKLSREIAPISLLWVESNFFYKLLEKRRTHLGFLTPFFQWVEPYFDRLLGMLWKKKLMETLQHFQPDVVHSLGINQNWRNLCQPMLEQKRNGNLTAPWVYSSWGTDLTFYHGLSPQNKMEVEAVIRSVDFYISESNHDREMAIQYGMPQDRFLGVLPAFGGVHLEKHDQFRTPGPVSERTGLYIKGRGTEDPVGRAMVIMDAIEKLHDILSGYTIYIGAASLSIAQKALEVREKYGLNIIVLPYIEEPEDVLRYVGMSRLFISITINDGLPASLVEAMALGAFPIFSNLPSIGEWITHGENGFLAEVDDTEKLAEYIRQALQDDKLVNRADEINRKIIRERLEYRLVRNKVVAMYQRFAH